MKFIVAFGAVPAVTDANVHTVLTNELPKTLKLLQIAIALRSKVERPSVQFDIRISLRRVVASNAPKGATVLKVQPRKWSREMLGAVAVVLI